VNVVEAGVVQDIAGNIDAPRGGETANDGED